MFSGEYCEIFKNSFSYRAPPVAASGNGWAIVKMLWKDLENPYGRNSMF